MRTQNRTRATAGFSMIELMVVVLIMAVLGSLGLPKYRDYFMNQSVVGLQTAILAKVREAPPLAKALRKKVTAVIDLDNNRAWLEVNGAQYGTKVPSNAGRADIVSIADGDGTPGPKTTGLAKYEFAYWSTVTDTPAMPSFTIHIGLQGANYVPGTAQAVDFRTITMVTATGRAYGYNLGCFGSSPTWANWKLCSDLL